MTDFAGVPAVAYALKQLTAHEKGPFLKQLPKQPGQKESRYVHLLGDTDIDVSDSPADIETVDNLQKPSLEFKQAFE
jgi:uncharacterized protein YceH (UPF0502 family)